MSTVTIPAETPVAEPVIDPDAIPCPCCGDEPWCPGEAAAVLAELRETPAVPLLVVGSAMYGRSQ